MSKLTEAIIPTIGTMGTSGVIGTGAQPDALASATQAYNNAIKANAALVAQGKPADPKFTKAAQDALAKLQKAAQDASKKLTTPTPGVIGAPTTAKIPGQADEETTDEKLNNSMAKKKLSPKQKKLAAAAAPHNKITGADFKALKKENTNIVNFLKAISQKNYASADKYLQSAVNERLKSSIKNAVDKTN